MENLFLKNQNDLDNKISEVATLENLAFALLNSEINKNNEISIGRTPEK